MGLRAGQLGWEWDRVLSQHRAGRWEAGLELGALPLACVPTTLLPAVGSRAGRRQGQGDGGPPLCDDSSNVLMLASAQLLSCTVGVDIYLLFRDYGSGIITHLE